MNFEKKGKSIRKRAIFSIFALILFLAFLGVCLGIQSTGNISATWAGLALLVIGIIFILIGSIMTFIDALTILITDWENIGLNDQKILWGILALFILGPVSTLVFSNKILKYKVY